ncbi:MAG: flagellar hook-associated protein 3 [Tindallia sp. MSAO_Bac2]|nr:MAG: flagellar hook-associated protein 3 [Tindallia sp. MSAO_Bac2]
MRITNNMMVQTMLNNMQRNVTRLNHSQTQYATGKRINKPSDDPLGINKTLRLRTDISSMDQYKRNVDDAYSFMDNTETAIRNMQEEGMNRVRELTVQASSETLTQEETIKIQAEIQEIRKQMIDLANYTYSGKHIFSGTKTNQPLLDNQGYYQMELIKHQDPRMRDDVWNFEMSVREKVQVNTLGFEVFEAEAREIEYNELPGIIYDEDNADEWGESTDNWSITLPHKDGSQNFTLNVLAEDPTPDSDLESLVNELIADNAEFDDVDDVINSKPVKLSDGSWVVGKNWEFAENTTADSPSQLIEKALGSIEEVVGAQLPRYEFSEELVKVSSLEVDDGNPTGISFEEKFFLVAKPENSTIVYNGIPNEEGKNEFIRSAWEIEQGDFSIPEEGNEPVFFEKERYITFNGVTIELKPRKVSESEGAGLIVETGDERNHATIYVDWYEDNDENEVWPDVNEQDYIEKYAEALNALSEQPGSEIEGFFFAYNDETDEESLKAIAPERSGSMYNKSYFGGTVFDPVDENDDPIDREAFRKGQLISTGDSYYEKVEKGQRAGLFQLLDDLEKNLLAGKQEDLSNMLDDIDAHMNSMLTARSYVGAKANRMELILYRIEDDTLNFRELMSKIEDADMAEVTMNLMNEENVYRASLNVGARVIQPTLLDFLR